MTTQNNGQTRPTNSGQAQENSSTVDQVRTPLLAALGAGNLATQAVVDTVNKAKQRVNDGTETARKSFEEFPTDVESLRGRLDPAELRKVIDDYTDAAWKLYNKLAESGEQAWGNVSEQPQLKRALDQMEEAIATAQGRFEHVSADARGRVDDVLGMVTKRTRSTGEKAARAVQDVASDAATKVDQAGDDLAHETRSTTRKAANKTAPAASSSASKSGTSSSGTSSSGGSSSRSSASNNGSNSSSNSTKKSSGGSTGSSSSK